MAVISLIFLVLLLGDLVWCWNFHRALRRFPQRRLWNIGLFLFTAMQVGGLLLLFFGRRFDLPSEAFMGKPVVAAIYIWHCLVLLPTAFVWFLWKTAVEILRVGRILAKKPIPSEANPSPAGAMTRRDFVSAALCATPAIAALGITAVSVEQWSRFRIRRLEVPVPGLPTVLDGLTIAQVTDLHVGVFTRGAILDAIVTASNDLRPDLVLLTGDLINYALSDLPVALDVVRRLQATHGVFLCEGNHDLFEDADSFRQLTRSAGLRLLVNESALLSVRGVALQILGLRWGAGHGDPRAMSSRGDLAIAGSMHELLVQRRPDAFPILLAHHPHAFDYAENIPLTLAGHTHGGQLMLTKQIGFGPAMFRYWSGLYQKPDRALVVSNGVGNWFPLRSNAPAEIVHLTLRRTA
ncbi:MAG: metallophosphoesterase [Chthoniobacter sp.]|uniref:metallophosphoesterase n=1 Tax=Chthoniobacter sp. TaxID=2510640 RepID=UPI0032A85C0E